MYCRKYLTEKYKKVCEVWENEIQKQDAHGRK